METSGRSDSEGALSMMATPRGAWLVLTVAGEIDAATAPALRQRLIDLPAEGHTDVLLDLTGVTFLDSTALGVLVGTYKRLAALHGTLAIVPGTTMTKRLLKLTALERVFPLYASVDDAVAQAPS
ncbi:SpoIIAA-like anti-anti-sigma regulatory factor [Motilibacter rhizosphaerae]|uniref:Anti-sigma factor antagonist n=1 Tax=Motilibacter rhizosphaerae TaxID=598652 RepID=A0A4Q7N794_9ACTN|nr:STAS domain-containing protein [Motilibacter rhizosphaerae]RZS77906.1 SpoIIAA-like anti-anti-sigma regulatory factor [Motilibacter rhizosphaerae]